MRLSACGTLGLLPSPGAKRRGEGLGVGAASKGGAAKEPPPPTPPHNAKTRWGRGTHRAGLGKPSAAHERASSTNDT
jgi:hypothetical protein